MRKFTAPVSAAVGLLALAAILGIAPPAKAEEGNPETKKECGACHMAFPPSMLPARSWSVILGDLANHFGEDATIAPDMAARIEAYLVANAGDTGADPSPYVRRIPKAKSPLRITEAPAWIRWHSEEVSDRAWKKAGSKSNCLACHQGAENGNFDDD